MLRALIIDDEQKGINSLKLLIEKFTANVKVVAETTDPEKGVGLIEDFKPEIVFLDINMPVLNGFEVLQKLKHRNFNLIFTTAHQEFAIKALRENAIDYLLKPIDADDLKQAIAKVQKAIAEKQQPFAIDGLLNYLNGQKQNKLPFNTKDRVEYIDKKDIVRLESDSNYTTVHLADHSKIMVSKTIGEYDELLCNNEHQFMRVHQSHIVNLQHVVRYLPEDGGMVVTSTNTKLPLSKSKKDEFMNWLGLR